MQYWLIKSEPDVWSWQDQVKKGTEGWDGVRNHLAAKHLRAMRVGDKAFFYHSNEGREIVGIVTITREFYPDPTDETGKFVQVDVTTDQAFKTPVTLKQVKSDPTLADMALVRLARLSVQPVTPAEWEYVCKLGGL